MTLAEPTIHRFTRREYYRMAEAGVFDQQRVELMNGEIIDMSPQNEPHALTISLIDALLHRLVPSAYTIRCQLPFVVNDTTEVEPDFAVITGGPRTQRGHPETAALVIEIADATLRRDRKKADVYAAADVPEYWIINLRARQIEVHTMPTPSARGPFAKRYTSTQTFGLDDEIKPENLPFDPIKASELFPI